MRGGARDSGQGLFFSHAAEGEFGGFRADGEFVDGDRAQRRLGKFGQLHVVETHQGDVARDFDATGF